MYSTKGLNLLHQQGNNRARRVADLLCNMRTRFAILSFIHSFKFIRLAQSEDSITYHRVNNEKERKKKKHPTVCFRVLRVDDWWWIAIALTTNNPAAAGFLCHFIFTLTGDMNGPKVHSFMRLFWHVLLAHCHYILIAIHHSLPICGFCAKSKSLPPPLLPLPKDKTQPLLA